MKFMVAIFIPAGVILFALLILLSKLRIILVYIRKGKDDKVSIKLTFLGGLFALKFDISTANVIQQGLRNILLNKREKKPEKKVGIKELYDLYKQIKRGIEEYSNIISKIRNYMLDNNRIMIEKISLDITIGLKDASITGIVSGIIQALTGLLDSFISNNFIVLDKNYSVRSDYMGEARNLKINLLCIISTRIVHIIMVGFILVITEIKKEILDRRWFKWLSIQ
jgi:hypothetical protein